MKLLQKFASVHANVHDHFGQERHLVDRQTYKIRHSAALAEWRIIVRLRAFRRYDGDRIVSAVISRAQGRPDGAS